ncbi:response regulator [Sphingomonas japonica]|uniref:DNA-binding response OmpR family regulator n=1 Tax=Sphingomonas japonica TaxID=511662 RepID=A0ABX0U723_9SPHN|nr:response regulator [Sphingomonas japonica]NIJ25132.1 DNA-binding response OmpR family regulator [Sphingomonas japonica]
MLFGRKKRRISRILLVEDEPLVAFDTEHFLTEAGLEIVATCDSVLHALEAITSDSAIDLVILDVELSDGSGLDVARIAHGHGIAVLFVTGHCPGEAKMFARGCLSKPYPQRDLMLAIDAIDAALAGGKQRKRLPSSFSLFGEPA